MKVISESWGHKEHVGVVRCYQTTKHGIDIELCQIHCAYSVLVEAKNKNKKHGLFNSALPPRMTKAPKNAFKIAKSDPSQLFGLVDVYEVRLLTVKLPPRFP